MTVDRPLLSIRRTRADDAPARPERGLGAAARRRATASRLIEHALATSRRDRELGLPVRMIARASVPIAETRSVVEDLLARPVTTVTLPEDATAFGGRTAVVATMTTGQLRRILTAPGIEHVMFASDRGVADPVAAPLPTRLAA
jgi:hypothetical protein